MINLNFKSHVGTKNGSVAIILDTPILIDSGKYGQITIHEIFPFAGGFQFARPGIENEFWIEPFPTADEGFPVIDLKNLKLMLTDPSEQKKGMDLVICTLLERLF